MLDKLVLEIQASAKYRHVSETLIRRIGAQELAARRSLKEAVKETKNTLHQIGGAFLDRAPRYNLWLQQLQTSLTPEHAAQAAGSRQQALENTQNRASACEPTPQRPTPNAQHPTPFFTACRNIMDNHASTRERLPLLETFYTQTLARIQPVRSILDLCCGLNPLALPWMPLAADATYHACDIYGDMMAFLNEFFVLAGVSGSAEVCDVVGSPPTQAVQVAFLLKALPPLEQTDKHAALRLLQTLQAEHILVSFPTRTLSGRNKQMGDHYEARFRALIAEEHWELERFAFANELCFLVSK